MLTALDVEIGVKVGNVNRRKVREISLELCLSRSARSAGLGLREPQRGGQRQL